MLDNYQLRQQILPMLETAGLIVQEQDPNDKRKYLIFPSSIRLLSDSDKSSESDSGVNEQPPDNNSEGEGGVKDELSMF